MNRNRNNKPGNDARQSSETDAGLGQDARAFGAGGQRDQNVGGQQHQQHDVDRDASLRATGAKAGSDRPARSDGSRS
jgi:hypothetical protein